MAEVNKENHSALYLVRGGMTLSDFNKPENQKAELSELKATIEEKASRALKTTVTVHDIIKYPTEGVVKEFDGAFSDTTAMVKISIGTQNDKDINPQKVHVNDQVRLEKLNNAVKTECTVKITLETLETIPQVNTWLEQLANMFELQTLIKSETYIIKGQWIHVAIARWILLELHQYYSNEKTFIEKHVNRTRYNTLVNFFSDRQFGASLSRSGDEIVVSSAHDIGLFCYFLAKSSTLKDNLSRQRTTVEWKLNFEQNQIDIHFKNMKEDKIKQYEKEFIDNVKSYKSSMQSIKLPNILPQNYKEFLLNSVQKEICPELIIQFEGIRHVYLVYQIADAKHIQEYINKYTQLNKPTIPEFWQTEPISNSQENLMGHANTKATISNASSGKKPENNSKYVALFQKEKNRLRKFHTDFAGKIKETARQYECCADYTREMILIEGNEKSNVLKYMRWLEDLYQSKDETGNLNFTDNHYSEIPNFTERMIPKQKSDLRIYVRGVESAVDLLEKYIADGSIVIKGAESSTGNAINNTASLPTDKSAAPVVPGRPHRLPPPDPSQSSNASVCFTYKHHQSGSTIEVFSGDITQQRVDAIVNAANGDLKHVGGVAKAIARAAGEELVRESDDTIRRLGAKIEPGETCTTSAGNLPCRVVIHAVGPMMKHYKDPKECTKVLRSAFENSLNEAFGQQCSSIAMPAISSGLYGVPEETVAYAAVATITEFLDTNHQCGIAVIKLVDINHKMIQLFSKEFEKRTMQGKYQKY